MVLALGAFGYLALGPAPVQNADIASRWTRKKAPGFELPTTAGAPVRLSEYRGKSNVLLFFNEGLMCAPCLPGTRA